MGYRWGIYWHIWGWSKWPQDRTTVPKEFSKDENEILIQILLKHDPMGSAENKPTFALVQIMACHRQHTSTWTYDRLVYRCICNSPSMSWSLVTIRTLNSAQGRSSFTSLSHTLLALNTFINRYCVNECAACQWIVDEKVVIMAFIQQCF